MIPFSFGCVFPGSFQPLLIEGSPDLKSLPLLLEFLSALFSILESHLSLCCGRLRFLGVVRGLGKFFIFLSNQLSLTCRLLSQSGLLLPFSDALSRSLLRLFISLQPSLCLFSSKFGLRCLLLGLLFGKSRGFLLFAKLPLCCSLGFLCLFEFIRLFFGCKFCFSLLLFLELLDGFLNRGVYSSLDSLSFRSFGGSSGSRFRFFCFDASGRGCSVSNGSISCLDSCKLGFGLVGCNSRLLDRCVNVGSVSIFLCFSCLKLSLSELSLGRYPGCMSIESSLCFVCALCLLSLLLGSLGGLGGLLSSSEFLLSCKCIFLSGLLFGLPLRSCCLSSRL